jgi:hypothetical protein
MDATELQQLKQRRKIDVQATVKWLDRRFPEEAMTYFRIASGSAPWPLYYPLSPFACRSSLNTRLQAYAVE